MAKKLDIELLKAWVHWVSLNPIDEDQADLARAVNDVISQVGTWKAKYYRLLGQIGPSGVLEDNRERDGTRLRDAGTQRGVQSPHPGSIQDAAASIQSEHFTEKWRLLNAQETESSNKDSEASSEAEDSPQGTGYDRSADRNSREHGGLEKLHEERAMAMSGNGANNSVNAVASKASCVNHPGGFVEGCSTCTYVDSMRAGVMPTCIHGVDSRDGACHHPEATQTAEQAAIKDHYHSLGTPGEHCHECKAFLRGVAWAAPAAYREALESIANKGCHCTECEDMRFIAREGLAGSWPWKSRPGDSKDG